MILSSLIPEHTGRTSRRSLLQISEILFWLYKNKPEVLNEARDSLKMGDITPAMRELDNEVDLWRERKRK